MGGVPVSVFEKAKREEWRMRNMVALELIGGFGIMVGILAWVERDNALPKDAFPAQKIGQGTGNSLSAPTMVRAYVTHYCATGDGCKEKICGGKLKTAWGRDATKGDGCAVDPRRIPYGTVVIVDGEKYISDDTFGKAQRGRDWKEGITHIDIRVEGKTHEEVRRMGAIYKEVEVLR